MARHGGKRANAGRPAGNRARKVTPRLTAAQRSRLDAVCGQLGYTHSEVMRLGLEAAEAKLEERIVEKVLIPHRLGTDEDGQPIYTAESAAALDARGVAYWADGDGLLHVER